MISLFVFLISLIEEEEEEEAKGERIINEREYTTEKIN